MPGERSLGDLKPTFVDQGVGGGGARVVKRQPADSALGASEQAAKLVDLHLKFVACLRPGSLRQSPALGLRLSPSVVLSVTLDLLAIALLLAPLPGIELEGLRCPAGVDLLELVGVLLSLALGGVSEARVGVVIDPARSS